jgi:large subunit ribosomal protein L3
MAAGLLGRKVGMTQIFGENGELIPVTVIEAGPCHVLQIRSTDRDGYEAMQLGFVDKPRRLAPRSERGHVAKLDSKRGKRLSAGGVELPAKAGCEPQRFIREIRGATEAPNGEKIAVGQKLTVEVFNGVKAVDVIGVTKGRGTAGVMKRHNMKGQRATHGVKKVHRHGGSTGNNTWPARVWKGKRMAGRYGNERSTMRNIRVVKVDAENNLLLVWGAVPGPNGGFAMIQSTNMVR